MTALPPAGPMQPGYNWGQILSSIGSGLSAAGSPNGGWSAFAPAVAQAQQNYQANTAERQRMAILEEQARRAQEQWETEQRTANRDAAAREQRDKAWADFIGNGPMAQGVSTASAPQIGTGPMQAGAAPAGLMDATNGFSQAQFGGVPDARAASKSLSNIPSGAGPDGIEGTQDDGQPGEADGFNLTPQQRQLLSVLGPDEGMKILAQTAFTQPKDASTDDMREYRQAVQQGFKGTFLDYQTTIRQAARATTTINMPGNPTPDERGAGAFAEANAKSQASYFDNVATAGAQAQTRMGDIDQLIKLIEVTPQGAGQDWINKGAAIASRFGIDAGEFANVPAAQAFQSIVSRIAPTLRVAGSGATSDFEMQQFMASLPAISNMPDGNRIIASNLKKITERSIQEANIAAQVQGGELKPAEGRKKILALGPLDLDLPSFGVAPAGGPGGAPGAPSGATMVPPADDPLGLFAQ